VKPWKEVFKSWGTMLGLIPFLVLLVYGAIVVKGSAKGAAANSVSTWILKEVGFTIALLLIILGLAVLIARRR
jgi:heme/copper-type cytochrome/quinol oxidase subunit 2